MGFMAEELPNEQTAPTKVPKDEYLVMQEADSLNVDSMAGPADTTGYTPDNIEITYPEITHPTQSPLQKIGGWALKTWLVSSFLYGLIALPRLIPSKVFEFLLPGINSPEALEKKPTKLGYMPPQEEVTNPTFEGFVKFVVENAVSINPDSMYPTRYDILKARASRMGRYNKETGKITLRERIEPHEKLNLAAIAEGKKAFSDLFEFVPAGIMGADITWCYSETPKSVQNENKNGFTTLADTATGIWSTTITFYPESTDVPYDSNVNTTKHELLHALIGMRHIDDLLPFAPWYKDIADRYSATSTFMYSSSGGATLDNQSLGFIDLEVLERYTGLSLPADSTVIQEVDLNSQKTRIINAKGNKDRVNFRYSEAPEGLAGTTKFRIYTGNGGLSERVIVLSGGDIGFGHAISANRGEIEHVHLFTNKDVEAEIFASGRVNHTFVSEEGNMAVHFPSGYGGTADRLTDTAVNDNIIPTDRRENAGDSIVFCSDITLRSVAADGDDIILTLQYPGAEPFTVTLQSQVLGKDSGIEAIVFIDANDTPRRFTGEELHTTEGIKAVFNAYRVEYSHRLSEKLDLAARLEKLRAELDTSYIPKQQRKGLEDATKALQTAFERIEGEVGLYKIISRTNPAVIVPDFDNVTAITVLGVSDNKELKLRIESTAKEPANEQSVNLTADGGYENMLHSIWLCSIRGFQDLARVNVKVGDIDINDLGAWQSRLNEGLELLRVKTAEEEKKVKLFLGLVDQGTAIFSVNFENDAVRISTTSTSADNSLERAGQNIKVIPEGTTTITLGSGNGTFFRGDDDVQIELDVSDLPALSDNPEVTAQWKTRINEGLEKIKAEMDAKGSLKKGAEATISDGIPRFFVGPVNDTTFVNGVKIDKRYVGGKDVLQIETIGHRGVFGADKRDTYPNVGQHTTNYAEFVDLMNASLDKKVILLGDHDIAPRSERIEQEVDLSGIDFADQERAASQIAERFRIGLQALKRKVVSEGTGLESVKEAGSFIYNKDKNIEGFSVKNHGQGIVYVDLVGASASDIVIGPETEKITIRANEIANGKIHRVTCDIAVTDAMRDSSNAAAQKAAWQEAMQKGIEDIRRQVKKLEETPAPTHQEKQEQRREQGAGGRRR